MRRLTPIALVLVAATPAVGQPCDPWAVVPTPNAPTAERTYARSIKAIAPDDVWVVGEIFNGSQIRPFSMRWDGSSWSFFPLPDPNDFATAGLWAVGASGPGNIWAAGHRQFSPTGIPFAGFGNHIAVWRWDGSAWELMPAPQLGGGSGDIIWEIAAIAPDDVWFVGTGHPTSNGPQPALAMHWDGSGFELTNVPLVNFEVGRDAGNPLNDISVIAPDDIWAVGGSDVTATGRYSQIHHWDGSGWTHRPGPTPGFYNELTCVAAISPNDVWAAGEVWELGGNIRALLIHWDGSSWTEVAAPGGFLDMVALASDDIWAVGNDIFHYDGESWSLVQSFPQVPYPALASISALGECEMWSAGRQIEGDSDFRSLVVRVNGGGGGSCAADWNGDGVVDSGDISAFLTAWLASVQGGTLAADFSGDGTVNSNDISTFLGAWLGAVQGGC